MGDIAILMYVCALLVNQGIGCIPPSHQLDPQHVARIACQLSYSLGGHGSYGLVRS